MELDNRQRFRRNHRVFHNAINELPRRLPVETLDPQDEIPDASFRLRRRSSGRGRRFGRGAVGGSRKESRAGDILRAMRYKIALRESEEGFSVSVPGLPGCWSQGETEEEALRNIQDAIQEYLAAVDDLLQDATVREVDVAV